MENIVLPTQPLYLVEGMIPRNGLTFLYGPPASGKSFLALHLAGCVSLGRPWFGAACERGGVLFLAFEGGPGVRTRLVAAKTHDPELGSAPIALVDDLIQLRNAPMDFSALLDAIDEMKCRLAGSGLGLRLIVIDTYARAMGNADENSSADMGEMLNVVETLARLSGAAILALAHPGKNQSSGLRGHSSMLAACDAAWEVRVFGEGRRSLQCVKNKDGSADQSFWFELEQLDVGERGTSCRVVEGVPRHAPSSSTISNATDRLIVRQILALREEHGEPAAPWCEGASHGFALRRQLLVATLRRAKPDRKTASSWSKQIGRRLEALICAGRLGEASRDEERWLWLTCKPADLAGVH